MLLLLREMFRPAFAIDDSPLLVAVTHGNIRAARVILQVWPDGATEGNHVGWTPLHEAVFRGDEPMLRAIAGAPGCFHAADQDGMTPLHMGVHGGQRGIVEYIAGVDASTLRIPNAQGWTPLHYAVGTDMVDLLLQLDPQGTRVKSNVGETPLHIAAWRGETQTMLQMLRANPAAIHEVNYAGHRPLQVAAMHGHHDLIAAVTGSPDYRPPARRCAIS